MRKAGATNRDQSRPTETRRDRGRMGPRFWGRNERTGETSGVDVAVDEERDGGLRGNRIIDLSLRRTTQLAGMDRSGARARLGWERLTVSSDNTSDTYRILREDRQGDRAIGPDDNLGARHADAGRHFLKFFLPIIPVMMFVFGFLYWYIALNVRNATPAASADATIPLMGGALLGLLAALLCVIAYLGYLNVRDREREALALPAQAPLER